MTGVIPGQELLCHRGEKFPLEEALPGSLNDQLVHNVPGAVLTVIKTCCTTVVLSKSPPWGGTWKRAALCDVTIACREQRAGIKRHAACLASQIGQLTTWREVKLQRALKFLLNDVLLFLLLSLIYESCGWKIWENLSAFCCFWLRAVP